MRLITSVPPQSYSQQWMLMFMQQLTRLLQHAISDEEEARRVILRSPNGTNYAVTVGDDGTLTTTLVPPGRNG